MSEFDDFNARVERTKKEADREIAKDHVRRESDTSGHDGFGRLFLSVFVDALGWMFASLLGWLVFAGIAVAAIAIGLGISFKAALAVAAIGFIAALAFAAATN